MGVGYRHLISEKYLHKVKQRSQALRGFNLVAILYKDNELIFKTRSGTPPYKRIYTQRVIIEDLNALMVAKMRFNNLAKFILDAKLKVFCDCDAFLYWGGKYWAWRKGFGIEKETRYPKVRQPYYKAYSCKHIYQVMSSYPWWSKFLAKKFKDNLSKDLLDRVNKSNSSDDLSVDTEDVPSDEDFLEEIE